jgi:hypothetical protein
LRRPAKGATIDCICPLFFGLWLQLQKAAKMIQEAFLWLASICGISALSGGVYANQFSGHSGIECR